MGRSRPPVAKADVAPERRVRKGVLTAAKEKQERTEIQVNIRLLPEELAMVDALVSRRRGRIPRHSWMLEAVQEKIERELDALALERAEEEMVALREGRSHTAPLEEVMREHGMEV